MHFTSSLLFIGLACAFSSAWAYPYPDLREIVNLQPEPLAVSFYETFHLEHSLIQYFSSMLPILMCPCTECVASCN